MPSGENATQETLQATELEASFLPPLALRPPFKLILRLDPWPPVGVEVDEAFPLVEAELASSPLKSHTDTTRSDPTVTRTPRTVDTA